MRVIDKLNHYASRPQPPVAAQTIKRVLLLNMLAFAMVMAVSFLRQDMGMWVVAVLPLGFSLGLYLSIEDHGMKAEPPGRGQSPGA